MNRTNANHFTNQNSNGSLLRNPIENKIHRITQKNEFRKKETFNMAADNYKSLMEKLDSVRIEIKNDIEKNRSEAKNDLDKMNEKMDSNFNKMENGLKKLAEDNTEDHKIFNSGISDIKCDLTEVKTISKCHDKHSERKFLVALNSILIVAAAILGHFL